MSSKYGVSYTVGKLFIILVRICKIWVTKPNYLVARGLQSRKKKVQFHKSISSKNFFGGWVNTITQGAFRITFDLIGIWPLRASKPPKRIFSPFFNLQGPLATKYFGLVTQTLQILRVLCKTFPTVYDTPYFAVIYCQERNLKILHITGTSCEPYILSSQEQKL